VLMPETANFLKNLITCSHGCWTGPGMPVFNEKRAEHGRKAVGEAKCLLNSKAPPKCAKSTLNHTPRLVRGRQTGSVARGDHELLEFD
jgi:hypothetical protein